MTDIDLNNIYTKVSILTMREKEKKILDRFHWLGLYESFYIRMQSFKLSGSASRISWNDQDYWDYWCD